MTTTKEDMALVVNFVAEIPLPIEKIFVTTSVPRHVIEAAQRLVKDAEQVRIRHGGKNVEPGHMISEHGYSFNVVHSLSKWEMEAIHDKTHEDVKAGKIRFMHPHDHDRD